MSSNDESACFSVGEVTQTVLEHQRTLCADDEEHTHEI